MLTASMVAAMEQVAPAILGRLFPNVRRVFATMDPLLGVAVNWAKAVGAELWVYAIDLHADGYWAAGSFLRRRFLKWRAETFARASRIFAISAGMADWLGSIGVRAHIELLPPLFPVGQMQPLPAGPLTFVMSGAVYSANARPLRWIEQAVVDLAPRAKLRLIAPNRMSDLVAAGLTLSRWSIASIDSASVAQEVGRAHWGIVGMDSGRADDSLRVAWPTKLREYLSVGRPVLCVSRPEYAVAKLARSQEWGLLACTEEETRGAVLRIMREPFTGTEQRARLAHAFAAEHIDDGKIGARLRRDLCA